MNSPCQPRIQIVIVLYKSEPWIARCLASVARAEYANKSVVVVDNPSGDGAAEIVERDFPWARLIRSEWNRGFAGGNNLGAKADPEAEIHFLLNPDTEIHPDCLARLAAAFASHPKLGVAGCKILAPDGETIDHVGGMFRANAMPYHRGQGEPDKGQYQGLLDCDYAQGAAMAVRRKLWDALGGLDEGFFPAYFEEADFCARARRLGWRVAVEPEAAVVHYQNPQEQVASRRFLEMLFRGRARYLARNFSRADWIFRFWPAELKWLLSRDSKGYRRIAERTLLETLSGSAPASSPSLSPTHTHTHTPTQ